MSVDPAVLRGDLFHLCGPMLEPGAVILPGNYGRLLRLYGWLHAHAMREHALEEARQKLAPYLPSRMAAAFAFLTLDEARDFRGTVVPGRPLQGFEGHLIYRVRLLDAGASWYVADHGLVRPPTAPNSLNADWPAMYWQPLTGAVGREDGVPVDRSATGANDRYGEPVAQGGVREPRVHALATYGRRELLTVSALQVVERCDWI